MRSVERIKRAIMCGLALRYPSFARLLRTHTPLAMQRYECSGSEGGRELMVFLPGLKDIMKDYELQGFVEVVRRTDARVDALVVDAHYGYYANRTVLDRLHLDVIRPAKARGYERVWLVGISMGGAGALLYASRFPGEISGVVALAPFLGSADVIREISAAGGVTTWTAPEPSATDYPRQLWRWLKQYENPTPVLPQLYLGYGDRDKFAPANQLLAEILSPQQVSIIAGRHDWATWKRLWHVLLPRWRSGSDPGIDPSAR